MSDRIEFQGRFGVEIELISKSQSYRVAEILRCEGIEIEVSGYTHATTQHWKIVSDCTIHNTDDHPFPMELVSPILEGDTGLRELKVVMDVIKNFCTVNKSCGLHVHHDGANLNLITFKNLAKLYYTYQESIDSFMPASRRRDASRWIASLTSRLGADKKRAFKSIDNQRSLGGLINLLGDRYCKLNLGSYTVHRSVEFRQHSGTVDFNKAVAWIKLTKGILDEAKGNVVTAGRKDNIKTLARLAKDWRVAWFYIERAKRFSDSSRKEVNVDFKEYKV